LSHPNKAIILAAGLGSRLGTYTSHLPKTLLSIGDLTIFDRISVGLDKIGVTDITVVIGYAESKLRSHILSVSTKLVNNRIKYEFIANDDLDRGNIYSFWLARNAMNKDFILANSDVVCHHDILELLKKDNHESALMVDDFKSLGAEEMKVNVNKYGAVKEITKNMKIENAKGEYIGIMKVSRKEAEKALEKTKFLLNNSSIPLYYEDAFSLLAKEEDCLFSCSTEGLPWTEVDTIDDMNNARNITLPQIHNRV
jgi:choline kinase